MAADISPEDALDAVVQGESDVKEMQNAGFSIHSVNDSLAQAYAAYERVEAARRLQDKIRNINYDALKYEEVLPYIQEIRKRKDTAFNLSDNIRALELELQDYQLNMSRAYIPFYEAQQAFNDERYKETGDKIVKTREAIEEILAEQTTVSIIMNASRSFLQKNRTILFTLFVCFFIAAGAGFYFYKRSSLRTQLGKLKKEKKVLINLIKNNQRQRFVKGSVSDMVYKVRMEKYTQRLEKVKQEIPVTRHELKRYLFKKSRNK